jgi:hypothetical protein
MVFGGVFGLCKMRGRRWAKREPRPSPMSDDGQRSRENGPEALERDSSCLDTVSY